MKMSVIRCLLIFLISVQIFVTLALSVENKVERDLGGHAAMTVADMDQEDGGEARADIHEGEKMIVNSKKSSGKSGSGGGNNAVHGDNKKSAASTTLSQNLSFCISACFTFSFLVLSF